MTKRKHDDECNGNRMKDLKEDMENKLKAKLKYFLNENVSFV